MIVLTCLLLRKVTKGKGEIRREQKKGLECVSERMGGSHGSKIFVLKTE